jgi:integrase
MKGSPVRCVWFAPMASKPYGSPREPTGPAFKIARRRGPAWYVKYRLPDGRQVQKKLGPAWNERGRPPAGYFTRRTAEARLREILDEIRQGTLPGMVETGATFADAAAEFLRFIEHDRNRKPSTVAGYQSIIRAQLLPVFGDMPIESITTTMIEAWIANVERKPSTKRKALVLMHGILQRARRKWGLRLNPVADVESHPCTQAATSTSSRPKR